MSGAFVGVTVGRVVPTMVADVVDVSHARSTCFLVLPSHRVLSALVWVRSVLSTDCADVRVGRRRPRTVQLGEEDGRVEEQTVPDCSDAARAARVGSLDGQVRTRCAGEVHARA